MNETLTEENFIFYAVKVYENPSGASEEDFRDDLKKIKYVKRLLNRYVQKGELRERHILNHLIVLRNAFGTEHSVRMLFFKLEAELHPSLKTFLLFLGYLPSIITGISTGDIITNNIPVDYELVKVLREIGR